MKTLLAIIMFFSSCTNDIKTDKNNLSVYPSEIREVYIEYVSLYMTTFKRVDYQEFDSSFESIKKQKTINEKKLINSFSKYLNQTADTLGEVKPIDTRIKLIVTYSNNKKSIYYVSRNYILISEKSFKLSSDFKKFLIDITDSVPN